MFRGSTGVDLMTEVTVDGVLLPALEDAVEVGDVADLHAHEQAVLTGDLVALDDLGLPVRDLLGDLPVPQGGPDADPGGDGVAERRGVDVEPVPPDHPEALEALHPLGDRRRRHPDAASERRHAQTGVVGELREDAAVGLVEHLVVLQARARPYFRIVVIWPLSP